MKLRKEFKAKDAAEGSESLATVYLNSLDKFDNRTIYLKGYIGKIHLKKNEKYRLYNRYLDPNLDKILTMLTEIDERNDDNKSMIMVSTFFIRSNTSNHLLIHLDFYVFICI
jgi:hypothetical protein